ncbi:TRADD-N-associated membrane domain-containing protein [Nostoc sp.]|uniref:TRADD-N-associated membrane domain-containing protein n=1 Tax=Nostoc sp. TaxID=1180 RepID=UPI002FFC88A3
MNRQSKTNIEVQPKDISLDWYRERSRQASASFNLAISLATATTILGVVTAVSVCLENVSAAAATTAVGLSSGVVSKLFFNFCDNANKRLDETAKELLEDD